MPTMGEKWISENVELRHGIRYPTPTSPYVFLTSLISSPYPSHRHAGQRAATMLNNYSSSISSTSQTFNNSLLFLKTMAEKERAKEIAFLDAKVQELEKLGEINEGKINSIKEFLLTMKNIPEAVDYTKFISLINTLLLTAEDFEGRLRNFTEPSKQNDVKLRANLMGSIETLMDNFSGLRARQTKSYEEIVRRLTSRFIETTDIGKILISQLMKNGATISMGEAFATTAAIIQDTLANYLLKHGLIQYQAGNNLDNFDSELARLEQELENFTRSIEAQQLLHLDPKLISQAKDLLGIEISAQRGQTKSHRKRDFPDMNAKNFTERQTRGFKKAISRITVKKQGNVSNLSFYEEIRAQIAQGWKGVHTGSKNLGTDAVYLFTMPSIETSSIDEEPILKELRGIYKDISSSSSPQQIATKYIENFTKINDFLKDLKSSFILHESTKFYLNTERGNHTEFKGREMNIFNYIEQAAFTNQFDPTILNFLAMNLASDAIGAPFKEPLEYYLSIFAGLIMFDDFALVAKELSQKLELTNIKNIHFYRLQSMYFPASYFLQMTYNKMQDIAIELFNEESYTTSISVPTINYYKTYQNSSVPMAQRWEQVRDTAEANTKIKIAFGQSFLSLIQQLSVF